MSIPFWKRFSGYLFSCTLLWLFAAYDKFYMISPSTVTISGNITEKKKYKKDSLERPLSRVHNTNKWESDVQIEFGNQKGGQLLKANLW